MTKAILFVAILFYFHSAWTQTQNATSLRTTEDSMKWISVTTDSGIVHAAVAVPKGKGPFPAIIILHGTHGFAQEYVELARSFAKRGFVGIAVCWFAGRKGAGERFITPIEFKDAPPLVDIAGIERFRIARNSIDMMLGKVVTLPFVKKDRLALFGHSRGAGASLDFVLTHPDHVQALILNSCGYPPEVTSRAAEVNVPVLILHGSVDNPADGGSVLTHIAMARAFEAALRAANKDIEAKYFEGSGHNGMFSNSAQFADTIERVSTFLRSKMSK